MIHIIVIETPDDKEITKSLQDALLRAVEIGVTEMERKLKDQMFSDMLLKITEIVEHLEGGALLYPGSYIFEEDSPAVDVLKRLIRRIKAAQ